MLRVFDDTQSILGEGALWHPLRQQFIWFDIVNMRLYWRGMSVEASLSSFQFSEHVSAAGWIDQQSILIATETSFCQFDLDNHSFAQIDCLEEGNPVTRSNDGRIAPDGSFWIGTMGKSAEQNAGAIYRWHKGKTTTLVDKITIPNAICFSPDGETAYYADSAMGHIYVMMINRDTGLPDIENRKIFVDLSDTDMSPDGAVVDQDGGVWNAQWDGSRVARYLPNGKLDDVIDLPTSKPTCPAFGGKDLSTLFITTAQEGMDEQQKAAEPDAGKVFSIDVGIKGQAEHAVLL